MRGFYFYYVLESYSEDSILDYEYKYQMLFGRKAFGEDYTLEQVSVDSTIKINPVIPPILSQDTDRSHLDPVVQKSLKEREQGALANYRQLFPYLEGETLRSDYVSILEQEWQENPKGTVVYVRSTNLGKIVFCIRGVILNQQTGLLDSSGIDQLLADLLPASSVIEEDFLAKKNTKTLLDAALSFASYVSFLLPGGAAIAGLISVIKLIFSDGQALSKAIANAVRKVLTEQDISNAQALFKHDYDWFLNNHGGDQSLLTPAVYDRFKHYLNDRLYSSTDLVESVTNIMGKSEEENIITFPLFISMASFSIILWEVQISIEMQEKGKIKNTDAIGSLISHLDDYIDHAKRMKDTIEGKIDKRMKLVTTWSKRYDPLRGKSTTSSGIGVPGAPVNINKTPEPVGYLQDEGFAAERKKEEHQADSGFGDLLKAYKKYYSVPYILVRGKKRSPQSYQPNVPVQNRNKKAYEKVLRDHTEHRYFLGSATKVQQIIDGWQKKKDAYKKFQ